MSAPDAVHDLRAPHPRAGHRLLIVRLRLGLLVFAAALLLLVIGWTVSSAVQGPREMAAPPLVVTSPRLMGQDSRNRPFVISAASAARETGLSQKIGLDRPVLTRDEGGPDALHVSAARGVYDEAAGRLHLSGGVQIDGASGHFTTASTVYDTRTGSLIGAGAVKAQGDMGQLQAKEFSVSEKGRSVIYKGGVHARINPR
jgi:lipopolysaccharide export system protein LptC